MRAPAPALLLAFFAIYSVFPASVKSDA